MPSARSSATVAVVGTDIYTIGDKKRIDLFSEDDECGVKEK